MTRIAAVDIGSNSVLMCVGEVVAGGDLRIVYDTARVSRLGERLDRTGRLGPAAVHRTVRVLEECGRKARILGVAVARAVATAAVREAKNPRALLDPAAEALGFSVEIISGEKEASLTFLGVTGAASTEPVLILDVGGASTEIVLGREGHVERTVSMPIGARRLAEAVPSEDLLRFFVRVISVIPDDLGPKAAAGRRVIAVGGTATTLAAVRHGMTRYDPEQVEGTGFTRTELAGLVEEIAGIPMEKRARIPGISEPRADIIASGGLALLQILEELGVEEFSVSARGLRHGILFELAQGRG